MDLSSYTPEQMEKAKHRSRAYQCVACHFQKGERWVDEIGNLEDHIIRTHIPPERIPFFCQLCKFKCLRQEQLVRHVTHYARHVSMAAGRGIIDHGPYSCRSQNPYQVTEMDYFKWSQEASLKFFLEVSTNWKGFISGYIYHQAGQWNSGWRHYPGNPAGWVHQPRRPSTISRQCAS